MKIVFLYLAVALVTGCANRPAELAFGKARRFVDRSSGYKSIYIPATLSNTSSQSIWYYGLTGPLPKVYTRPAAGKPWKDEGWRRMCAYAYLPHELPARSAVPFWVFFPADEGGQQFRLEMRVFKSPDKSARWRKIKSRPAPIQ